MAMLRKQIRPDRFAQPLPPIKYLTENGFSIVRLSDVDPSVINTPRECRFLVHQESGIEREVAARFTDSLISDLRIRRRARLSESSVFWLVCAESYLARFLWEKNEFPPQGQLIISELSPDELMLALHWRDQE